jgi:esterase/lipase
MTAAKTLAINEPFYQWCVKGFTALRKRIGMNIRAHDDDNAMADGEIFVFNHFARFETIIPQYFIYQKTGVYCRCVATHELFEGSERFARLLWGVGAVPNDLPGLLPFLAAEILRGRKVIIFPEGSMMKDRSMTAPPTSYFKSKRTLELHRQGAAALAVVLELFKKRILAVNEEGDHARLGRWVTALGLADESALLTAARRPTLIVPSNITFHPLHLGDNILRKAAALLHVNLGRRGTEELLVEGNLILRDTDMDIRFGKPIHPDMAWGMTDRMALARVFEQIDSLDDLFSLKDAANHWVERMAAVTIRRATRRLRDLCMVEMYARVTVNVSHLASRILLRLMEQGEMNVSKVRFGALLYSAIKAVQREPDLHLHRALADPDAYDGLHGGKLSIVAQLLKTAEQQSLIEVTEDRIRLLPKLRADDEGIDPRLHNAVKVYANEVAALPAVVKAVESASVPSSIALAELLFDDELRAHDRAKLRHQAEPGDAAATDGAPYLVLPQQRGKPGIVLVHGLLASPAELRHFGRRLADLGHPVIGVRLKGHGTSPWDLRERTWPEWLQSVARGHEIMALHAEKVIIVGFATGASLALQVAADQSANVAAVIAVAPPLKFRLRGLRYTPLIDRLNRMARWTPMKRDWKPFQAGEPEHAEIDYRDMPVHSLMELQKSADALQRCLPRITCPVTLIQATDDPVVDPESAKLVYEALTTADKRIHMVQAARHGILHEDVGVTQSLIIARIAEITGAPEVEAPMPRKRFAPRLNAAIWSALSPLLRFGRQRNA